jgi:spermidine synthase
MIGRAISLLWWRSAYDHASGMSINFEELDYRPTPMGVLTLRRRRQPGTAVDVYEIKLGDEFLMSSAFTAAEIALADLGLAALRKGEWDVVVGGLGLGYTAQAALTNPHVRSLIVVDALPEVIEWHQAGLLPVGRQLMADPRCRLVHGDFFAMAASSASGFDPQTPGRRFDAILLDVDHSPDNLLHPSHASLYDAAGLQRLSEHLKPGGVFALWSNDPPEANFQSALVAAFAATQAHVVAFENLHGDDEVSNTVYVGVKAEAVP